MDSIKKDSSSFENLNEKSEFEGHALKPKQFLLLDGHGVAQGAAAQRSLLGYGKREYHLVPCHRPRVGDDGAVGGARRRRGSYGVHGRNGRPRNRGIEG